MTSYILHNRNGYPKCQIIAGTGLESIVRLKGHDHNNLIILLQYTCIHYNAKTGREVYAISFC